MSRVGTICRDFLEMSPITMSTYRGKSRPNLSKGADRVIGQIKQLATMWNKLLAFRATPPPSIFLFPFPFPFFLFLIFGSFSQDTQLYMFQLSFDTLTTFSIYHCFPVFFLTSSVELSITHSIEIQNQRPSLSIGPVIRYNNSTKITAIIHHAPEQTSLKRIVLITSPFTETRPIITNRSRNSSTTCQSFYRTALREDRDRAP